MTMLDDDRLVSLLTSAGTAFEVPATGPDDILTLAHKPATTNGGGRVARGDEALEGNVDAGEERGAGEVASPPRTAVPRDGRRVVTVARRHRVLSVAACLVVVLLAAGAIGALVSGRSTGPRLSAIAPPPRHAAPAGAPATTTTGPDLQSKSGTTAAHGYAAAPFSATNNGDGTATGTTPNAPALPKGAVGQPAKIEQTGTLGLTVGRGDLRHAMTQLTSLASTYGGFVANSQTQSGAGSGGPANGTVTLQVPVDNFAALLKAAQGVGKTSSLTTKATDVTGQYVDLQSRVTALEASRQQYLTIMTKATTVGDVLAVQSQLDTIQSQIEQLQGQLNTLGSETSYSALTANLSEGAPPARPGPVPESGFIQAWHDSIGGFVTGVDGVVRVAGPLLFALLCLAVVLVGGRALWRRVQRHRL